MAWVQNNISLSDVGSGFFARFLLFYPPQKKVIPPALPQNQGHFDRSIENQIKARLESIQAETPMRISAQAAENFEEIHKGIYAALEQCGERDQELLAPYAKRRSPYVLKLAMLFQVVIDPETDISIEAVQAGAAIVEYAIKSTVHLFQGELGESLFQKQCRAILEYIAKHGGEVKRHQLLASRILEGGAREYNEVLETLEQQDQIMTIDPGSNLKKYEVVKLAGKTEG